MLLLTNQKTPIISYQPNSNLTGQKFNKLETNAFQGLVTFNKVVKKDQEFFVLNNFIRKIGLKQDMAPVLQRLHGVGPARSSNIVRRLAYTSGSVCYQNLTKNHFSYIVESLEDKQYILLQSLKNLKKNNIIFHKSINSRRGLRHSAFLPVRGQRTHSNAHVSRYLGSGTFEFVPKRPSSKLKKLSKFSRRKKHLVDASNSRFNRLLNKSHIEFQKNNKRLYKQLAKKNKLGVFGKLHKEKIKVAKAKAKKNA